MTIRLGILSYQIEMYNHLRDKFYLYQNIELNILFSRIVWLRYIYRIPALLHGDMNVITILCIAHNTATSLYCVR